MSLESFVKTKIIVTVGPATETSDQLERLVEAIRSWLRRARAYQQRPALEDL